MRNLFVLPSLWSDDMDIETIEVFQNNHLGVTRQVLPNKFVHFNQLRYWHKNDVNRRVMIDFFYVTTCR